MTIVRNGAVLALILALTPVHPHPVPITPATPADAAQAPSAPRPLFNPAAHLHPDQVRDRRVPTPTPQRIHP